MRIEAIADPTPPAIDEEDLDRDIERLIAGMQHMTEQEAKDQVYRRVVLYLCNRCYARWIEHPSGD